MQEKSKIKTVRLIYFWGVAFCFLIPIVGLLAHAYFCSHYLCTLLGFGGWLKNNLSLHVFFAAMGMLWALFLFWVVAIGDIPLLIILALSFLGYIPLSHFGVKTVDSFLSLGVFMLVAFAVSEISLKKGNWIHGYWNIFNFAWAKNGTRA